MDAAECYARFGTRAEGLTAEEARARLAEHGPNAVPSQSPPTALHILARQFQSPLVILLVAASAVAALLGSHADTVIILVMVLLGGALGFGQEYQSERALRTLRRQLERMATVRRDGVVREVRSEEIVPGDILELELGTVLSADVRLVSVDALALDESALTGESVPVAKTTASTPDAVIPQDQLNMAFLGTHVVQGAGQGIVTATGSSTQLGNTAALLTLRPGETEFQRGLERFGRFLLRVTLALAVVVFVVLGVLRGDWADAALFSVALAVGIAPELLPVIVSINLSRGATAMSRKGVLVKRLIAIEDLGNAAVLCTDKTGTLTEGRPSVTGAVYPIRAVGSSEADVVQVEVERQAPEVLSWAALCLDLGARGEATNPLDAAISEHVGASTSVPAYAASEAARMPFDFFRRRMSTVVDVTTSGVTARWLVTKGAVSEVLDVCSFVRRPDGSSAPLDGPTRAEVLTHVERMQERGVRLVAVATRRIDVRARYDEGDEHDLELIGHVTLSDVPKSSAASALESLADLGVRVVVLTGDNEAIARHVAETLGFPVTAAMDGQTLARLDDAQLADSVAGFNLFARITPSDKLRIVQAFRQAGHNVAFMGDGINDAPAIRASDVGISFQDAVDVAREAASVLLLHKDLGVLADGIREGRRTFVNTRTYIRATISSNFGNMLSVAGAALLLPFLPLLPAQILLLNLLSDVPMLAISTDRVPSSELKRPKKWDVPGIANYMYFFGSISSIADYVTFALLLYVSAGAVLFRSGWFLESALTELVVIFLVRVRRTTRDSLPSLPLVTASLLTAFAVFALPYTDLGRAFQLIPLPLHVGATIVAIVAGYALLTMLGKSAYEHLRGNAEWEAV